MAEKYHSHRLLYLATDLFSKGGIQRYSRTQVQALRELLGEQKVTVFSLHPPGQDRFEEPFETAYSGKRRGWVKRLCFSVFAAHQSLIHRPSIIWVNHINLLPLANLISYLKPGIYTIGNVYGWEVWSRLQVYKRKALQKTSQIVSDCHFTANYVKDAFGISEKRLSVIWDPVDVRKFVPRDTAARILPKYGVPYDPNNCYLMTLGRIAKKSRHKGYDRMLNIMHYLGRDDVKYLLAGEGDDRHRLENRVRGEGLRGRVFFLGSITESDIVDIYNAADVFVLVSDRGLGRGEGVPLTPLEAAACGKPIIVGDEDGSPEAVNDGESGYVVSPSNLDMIRQAILRLVDNPDLRRKMGRAARTHIEQDFCYEAFKSRTAAVLDLLNGYK